MRTTLTGALCLILLISSSFAVLTAKDTAKEKPSLTNSNVEGQFDYVIQESGKYEEYRVIKNFWLYRLKSNVLDTLGALRNELGGALELVSRKDMQIDSLLADLQHTQEDLAAVTKARNTLSFLGIAMHKNSYNSMMWTLTAVLAAGLFIFAVLYKRSHVITARTKDLLHETKNSLDAHKKRALEREQKIMRGLYDEILKYKKKCGELH